MGYLVVPPVYVACMVWNWAVARRGAAVASSFTLLLPVASGMLSVAILGEAFDGPRVIGFRGHPGGG